MIVKRILGRNINLVEMPRYILKEQHGKKDCALVSRSLYVSEEYLSDQMSKFGRYISKNEIITDIFREARLRNLKLEGFKKDTKKKREGMPSHNSYQFELPRIIEY